MKRQEYYCEECGVESHVMHESDEELNTVVRKIAADHRKWSPECKTRVERLRVINHAMREEWPDIIGA